jgi:FAD/FMN-containing dehydrogenase/Fe-S oxidoreductase
VSSHPEPAASALASLLASLRREVRGEVDFSPGARAMYALDASSYRRVPVGVVFPTDAADVEAAVASCRRHDAAVLPRGAGTSLAGQGVNAAVVLDLTRHMDAVVDLDPERRLARVQPGLVLDRLQEAARPHGLAFGPDPSTHAVCTLGGMLGNNACGAHSVTAGRTSDNVETLEVLTHDGACFTAGTVDAAEMEAILAAGGRRAEIHRGLHRLAERSGDLIRARLPRPDRLPRRVSGYNLDELLPEHGFHVARSLVGTEGTCAVFLEATVRLVPRPPHRALVLLGFPGLAAAADRVPEILEAGRPHLTALEGMDRHLLDNHHVRTRLPQALALFPPGRGNLVVEVGAGSPTAAAARAQELAARWPAVEHRVVSAPDEQALVWRVRSEAVGTLARGSDLGRTHPGWEDSAVPPARLGDYLRDLDRLLDRHGLRAALYGHFGDGCVHARIDFDLATAPGIAAYRRFLEDAADLVASHGGSLSGEHGDGQARGELLGRLYGDELVAEMAAYRKIWDPVGRMNPGKVVHPRPLDADLAPQIPLSIGSYQEGGTWSGSTWSGTGSGFRFPEDGGRFEQAVGRCVGVGKCRQARGGVMCPSFRATDREEHSPRGRARLLGSLLRGEDDGAAVSEREVLDALGLCLACKACKSECPAGVDVATYKAELLHRHHRSWRHPRPRIAWALGLSPLWLRWTDRVPGLWRVARAAATAGPAAGTMKRLAGIHPDCELPPLAPRPFPAPGDVPDAPGGGDAVLLFPDTFTRFFAPGVGRATARALTAAGHAVHLPDRPLCCGRPLFDFGMLGTARRWLGRTMDGLAPHLDAGRPVVVPEPSCAAVFRDELPGLFPGDPRARALAAAVRLPSEVLLERTGRWTPPERESRPGRALLHTHCHQRAVLSHAAGAGEDPDRRLLEMLGFEVETTPDGCCGMAGAFGFAEETHEVSRRVAELGFAPAVERTGVTRPLVSGGFSCREQARQLGRAARHPLELLDELGYFSSM